MDRGYFKMWRKILDSRVFQNEGLLKVWVWCLARANHTDCVVSVKTGRGDTEVHLKAGQFIFGRHTASEKLKMKPSTVRNRILKLKNIGNLVIQTNTHFSIITLTNQELYNPKVIKKGQEKGQPKDNQRTTKGQPKDTGKNDKNVKNDKNLLGKIPAWIDQNLWKEYIQHRIEVKSPLTELAQTKAINKLQRLISESVSQQDIIDQTIENGWKGFFEYKKSNGKTTVFEENKRTSKIAADIIDKGFENESIR